VLEGRQTSREAPRSCSFNAVVFRVVKLCRRRNFASEALAALLSGGIGSGG
jgi:hypothetical protein